MKALKILFIFCAVLKVTFSDDFEFINPLNNAETEIKERSPRGWGLGNLFKKQSAPESAYGSNAYGFSSAGSNSGSSSGGNSYSYSSSSSSSSSSGSYGGGRKGYGVMGYGGSGGGSYGIKTNLGYGGNMGLESEKSGKLTLSSTVDANSVLQKVGGFFGLGGGSGYYGGNKMHELTHDFLLNARQQIPGYGSCAALPLPSNVEYSCHGEQCELKCPGMFSFPDGKTELKVVCINGQWIIRDSEYVTVPPCQASCLPPCQNNGICLEPGKCKCSENFSGPYCQFKKSICATKPPVPKNSKVSCMNHVCNAECYRGFQYPDGSTITNIVCEDNQWIHSKTKLTKPPDCQPICDPPCTNGGQCISFNVCNCGAMHRGDHCQFSVSVCNITKTDFNGNYKCSFDQTEASCQLLCPDVPGLKVKGDISATYKCRYEDGFFLPKPLPHCIFPEGYVKESHKFSQKYIQHESGYKFEGGGGGGGGAFGIRYVTEHERLMALLSKFKQYDIQTEWWSSEETTYITPSSYSLYMTGDVNLVIDRTPKPVICTLWGGINVKTFDGLIFKAPLSCSHTLITDIADATFDITLKACPYGSGYGCAHSLKIYWQSIPYVFENQNGTISVHTPTKNLPIPVQVMGMKVMPVAQHTHIFLEAVGLKIVWDHHQYVAVYAGPALWTKVGGICGSLDGDYKNDLISKHGDVLKTVKAFVDSWRVEDESDLCLMENSAELEFGSQSCDPAKRKKAAEVCERLLGNEKLTDCVQSFNIEALLHSCVDDYCNCPNHEHPESCNCDNIAMLANECMFKGVKLEHGWRNLEICPISCTYGRIYMPCGPEIEPTCDSVSIPTKGKCNEGCFCPEGTVQYKEACITPELCPCTMGGKEFKPETAIKKHCNTCTCKNGQWKCTDEKCGARCGAVGDPHYQTFDGKRYNFMGKCSYYLLKTPNLAVEAENVACSGMISENLNFASAENPSCTKSVTIRVTLKNGVQTTIKLSQGMATSVNNKEILKFPKVLGAGEVLLRQASSTFMTVEFPDGIKIWWDGISRAYIDAPPSYRGKTSGLCGTFNSNTQDDFLSPEGDVETAVEAFADKWRTKDTCDHLAESTAVTPHPCTVNPEKRAIAEKHCAWITEDIFQDCHWTVEPEKYYEDCLYDVCACKADPAQCFCPILAAYGDECMRQGIKTGWRLTVKECAVKCPLGQVFDECGDSCTRTCEDLATKNTCPKDCVEGCRCPHGEYLNENNECVPQNKCPCTYDGIPFKPGYKEVRPGKNFLDLCTCVNGLWECEDAAEGDEKKYPPSSELRTECAKRPFAEFTKCAPKEPKTCKNMHEYVEDLEDCTPGCVCMKGYVYDMSRKDCVLPESCSCHHGGKSYNDGEKMKEDCNLCVCKSGKWECTNEGCDSTCSVWGDSHFTTFDSFEYDFQGECDYILAKGIAPNGDGFTITIQNVLCGTLGVTCSKSLELALSGSVEDSIELSKDSTVSADPNKMVIKKLRDAVNSKDHSAFNVYKAGVFVVVEVLPLKLQIKWDEGTRVYVKLGNEWKNKVSGLCGNYNDNAMDDMISPSGGMETNPLIFGHSWRKQKNCLEPKQPIDACKEHPQREAWAQLKCGALKSDLFKECHSEVPVEKYLKRCIYDSCACDQGGDCECLCTAISAYAHACSQRGVNIRWRTPHFCPMQCDPHCAEYKSCTAACGVETCDNFLEFGIAERICNKENCVEGCQIKPCAEGMIYLNDTYKECVPKAECKPICMIKDGITYYEGDVTFMDSCATCRCSKKKEVCSGVKCSEPFMTTNVPKFGDNTTPMPMRTEEESKCVKGWTRWFDSDEDASGKLLRLNDEEKLPRYDRLESVYGTCLKKYMKEIECRVVGTHESSSYMDENVFCNLQEGLACIGQCHDYEIRVFCQCDAVEATTTAPYEKIQVGNTCDSTVAEYKEYPRDCHKFLQCTPQDVTGEWTYVEKTCGEFMMFNPTMNICDHIETVQIIKPSCGGTVKEETCPDGMVQMDCANQCEHTCHYYGMILRKRGLCHQGEHCKPGCVKKDIPNCKALGKYWRDEFICVDADECPCMDKNEKYVQPHMPVIGETEVCQCIDNAYSCIENTVETIFINTAIPEREHMIEFETFPVTSTPPMHCKESLMVPLIEGHKPLPDTVFNASSSLGMSHKPAMARLSKIPSDDSGSWSPEINDQMQYLQVTFEKPEPLFGILMAGSPSFDNYVTLFKILYSHDGEAYHYLIDETETPQKFNGPMDSRTPMKSFFKIPIEAKSVRIYPLKWHNSIAMRVDLLGCKYDEVSIVSTTTPHYEIIKHETTEPPKEWESGTDCKDEMGVEKGKLNPQQVRASSVWNPPQAAKKPRLIDLLKLSSPLGWRPVVNTPNEYVEFDFLEPRNITGFITKGGPDGWVTGFKVLFSKNKIIWNKVLFFDGLPKIYSANRDSNTEVLTQLRKPLLTQYLRVMPEKWEKNINMRIEPMGCYEPYLVVKDEIKVVETQSSKCLVCEGIQNPNPDSSICKCKDGLFWDGNNCVQNNLCPCVENYIPYPIGSKFENQLCEDCVCVLGGHSSCKPKKCPPCEGNLRPVISSGCYCKCEPCPKHQRLCPSSSDCIPEALWCNGVQDCADDENPADCVSIIHKEPDAFRNESHAVVIKCPEPKCPPQMNIKFMEKKSREMSHMFTSTVSKKYSYKMEGNKVTKTKTITITEENLPMPGESVDVVEEEECPEFTCIPIPQKLVNKNETFICIEPKCPDNYDVELDMSASVKAGECRRYTCILRPKKDDVCEVSGKSFTTFDGTEFKYPTCSHILARDIANSNWIISVHLQCDDEARKVCRKMITIKDLSANAVLTILPNLKLIFNGFEFTVNQLINSPICKASFVVSQPGNTVLVVSQNHGFWVSYDDIGYIKIGMSSKYINTVDGLCGYYNGIPSDDKRGPDGNQIPNTASFGDSWFDKKIPKEECYPQTCPLDIQKKALSLCNAVKQPTFMKCGKAVNYKQFVSKCIETTCECLKVNNGDTKACQCNILQDFVKKCLTVNPNVQLDTWRSLYQCEIQCPAPLIHSDCYKRRCEPSCETLTNDDCAIIPDVCFSGCYCPEGTVRKGDTCVPVAECKDCVCNSFGPSKYFTYDRHSFTFNGNCTYLLSRDIVLPGVYTFQVYITMDDCKKMGLQATGEHQNCAKSLHILNGDHLIHIQRDFNNPHALQALVDGFEVKKMPYKDNWIQLRDVSGKELILTLPESHVELRADLHDLAFSLGVPSVKYGDKLEGLCGDCDGNPNNDLVENPAKKKGRKPSTELGDVIRSWQADEPRLGLGKDKCLSEEVPQDECIPLPPEKDPCMLLFNDALFGKCNMIVDPVEYVSACQQDLCKPGSDQKGACNTLSAYAKECSKQGICLNWRSPDLCPYDCPVDTFYEFCGCAKTCDTIKKMSDYDAVQINTNSVVNTMESDDMCSDEERFEGCFCPPGKVMDNGKCVPEEQCIKCEDSEHLPGDKWQKDKCTSCECDKTGKTQCIEKKCLVEENICSEGFMPKKIIAEEDCCPRYVCVPEPKEELSKLCLEPLMPICGPGQIKKQKTGPNGCPQIICECKPKEECEPLTVPRELKPGEKLVKEDAGCCPTQKIVCDKTACPKPPEKCLERFYTVVKKQTPDDCCAIYKCEPPKDNCIVQFGPKPEDAFIKNLLEKWTNPNDPCKEELCTYGPNDSAQIITTTMTCETKCPPGFTYKNVSPNTKCCGECIQTECEFENKLFKPFEEWKSADNCTMYTCLQQGSMLIVSSSKETCPDVSHCKPELLYEEGCCKYCKTEPEVEDMKNCLPVSLSELETLKLVKWQSPKNGLCTNKESIHGFTECLGTCQSGSKFNVATLMHDKMCHCCNIKSFKSIEIPLSCEDGSSIKKEVQIPAACGCMPCSDSVEYQTDHLIDIRLHPLPLAQMIQNPRN